MYFALIVTLFVFTSAFSQTGFVPFTKETKSHRYLSVIDKKYKCIEKDDLNCFKELFYWKTTSAEQSVDVLYKIVRKAYLGLYKKKWPEKWVLLKESNYESNIVKVLGYYVRDGVKKSDLYFFKEDNGIIKLWWWQDKSADTMKKFKQMIDEMESIQSKIDTLGL